MYTLFLRYTIDPDKLSEWRAYAQAEFEPISESGGRIYEDEMNSPENTSRSPIPGYDYAAPKTAVSPVSDSELSELERTAGWSSADADVLARHADLFRAKAEAMVDSWRAVIGSQPHLAHWFVKPDGTPDDAYKASVKRRFVQQVVDVALCPHERDWLNYQEEIGLRHTPAKEEQSGWRAQAAGSAAPMSCWLYPRGSSHTPVLRRSHQGRG